MDINTLRQSIDDITAEMETFTSRDMVEDSTGELNTIKATIEEMVSNDEIDDQDYQELMQEISDSKYLIKESYNSRKDDLFNEETEDTYYDSDDDDDDEYDEYDGLNDY